MKRRPLLLASVAIAVASVGVRVDQGEAVRCQGAIGGQVVGVSLRVCLCGGQHKQTDEDL